MSNIEKLKSKIIKINSYSIFLLILLFSLFSFATVYFVISQAFNKDIEFTKQEYLSSQKSIIKNQVDNFVNFIEHTEKLETNMQLQKMKENAFFLANILKEANPQKFEYIINQFQQKNPNFKVGLSDIKGNLIYTTALDFSKERRLKLIDKLQTSQYFSIKTPQGLKYISGKVFVNIFNNKKYLIANAIYQKNIDEMVKKIVVKRVNSIKFGAKNNGYISIAKILNYKGGKKFAQVVALPVKPEWVGKYLNDDKKDAKGKMYRKEYLKIANTTLEGYVSYWFFKKKTKQTKPKLSYVKLYKKYDWLIFTSVYIDDIYGIIEKKEETLQKELSDLIIIYLTISLLFLILSHIITKYENGVLSNIMDKYDHELSDKNNELKNLNLHLQDEIKEKTAQLMENLFKDPLTKLPNREKLLIDFEQKEFVALLNIDSFKEINDFYGIEVGDKVLKEISYILSQNNIVYKMAGDEFAILDNDMDTLYNKLHTILKIVENSKIVIDENISIEWTMSCGVAKSLSQADMALKYAKLKNIKIVKFSEDLPVVKEYENNLKWKNMIKQAIKSDNIIPFVQPLVNTKTKKTDKFECLIRLKNQEKIYTPYFFLDISKKTGQYQELQKIMIEKSFEKFKDLDYKFSINLSVNDLSSITFQEYFINLIDKYEIENKLIVELLEDEGLLYPEVIGFLILLNQMGVEVAIDDFGSGYSNFSYLITKLPVTILKIDGSLVKNIVADDKHYRLLKSIVKMAKEFDLSIVAEFVENEEIVNILESFGVDYLQGYYFSAPFDMNKI